MLVKGKKHTSKGTFRGNLYANCADDDVSPTIKTDCDENKGTERKGLSGGGNKKAVRKKRRGNEKRAQVPF
jgi:hypothetical protein